MRRAVLKQFSLIFCVDHSIAVLLGKEIEEWRMIIDGTSYKCKLNCMCLSVVHSLYACVCVCLCVCTYLLYISLNLCCPYYTIGYNSYL